MVGQRSDRLAAGDSSWSDYQHNTPGVELSLDALHQGSLSHARRSHHHFAGTAQGSLELGSVQVKEIPQAAVRKWNAGSLCWRALETSIHDCQVGRAMPGPIAQTDSELVARTDPHWIAELRMCNRM